MKLSDAIKSEGYQVLIRKHPSRVKGGLGKGSSHMWARAYQNENGSYGIALSADK